MRRFLKLTLTCSLFTVFSSLNALVVEKDALDRSNLFSINFPGEGRDIVLHQNRISSISIHDYVTSVLRVKEIVLDSMGASTVRIYHARPLTEEELAGQFGSAARQAGGATNPVAARGEQATTEAARMIAEARQRTTGSRGGSLNLADTIVVKDYPATTHARSIEYRISDEAELLALYSALRNHWTSAEDPEADPPEGDEEPERLRLGGTQFTVER